MAGLVLEFSDQRGATVRRLGPYDLLSFEGEILTVVPGGHIAQHVQHAWRLWDDSLSTRLDCNMPVIVQFVSQQGLIKSKKLGPFGDFSSVDGVAYVDRRVFAFVDRQQGDWYSHDLGTHWKVMVVEQRRRGSAGVGRLNGAPGHPSIG